MLFTASSQNLHHQTLMLKKMATLEAFCRVSDILNVFGDGVTSSSSSSSSSLLLWGPNLVLGFLLILEREEEGE